MKFREFRYSILTVPIVLLVVLLVVFLAFWISTGHALAEKSISEFVTDVARGTRPTIASDVKGHLYIAYKSFETHKPVSDIFFTTSSNEAKSWSESIEISKTPGMSSHPQVGIEKNGAIDVAWSDTIPGEPVTEVYFSRSEDSGKQWSKPVNISLTPGSSTEPTIATGPDGSIHVAWIDTTSGAHNPDVYYSSSCDSGKSWSKPEDIGNSLGFAAEPALAIDSAGTAHVVFADLLEKDKHNSVIYQTRKNGQWSAPIHLSVSGRLAAHPSIACGAKNSVHICWTEQAKREGISEIMYASGHDTIFSAITNVSKTLAQSTEPRIACDGDKHVLIVWSDSSVGNMRPDIFLRASSDSGAKFAEAINISDSANVSKSPDVLISGSNAFIVWQEDEDENSGIKVASLSLESTESTKPAKVKQTVAEPAKEPEK